MQVTNLLIKIHGVLCVCLVYFAIVCLCNHIGPEIPPNVKLKKTSVPSVATSSHHGKRSVDKHYTLSNKTISYTDEKHDQTRRKRSPNPQNYAYYAPSAQEVASNPSNDNELRHKLLLTLENRLQERNMLLQDNELLREKELLREREMNRLLDEHSHSMENPENYINRKSFVEQNGLYSRANDGFIQKSPYDVDHHSALDSNYLNPMDSTMGSNMGALLQRNDLMQNVGNLGDETLPFGSLGLSKSGYIPVGRVDDNQLIPNEEATDIVHSAEPHHHSKPRKSWVTDVNVYSKKKHDDYSELFNDDNDPLDEFDPCESKPCRNGGLCKVVGNTEFMCLCPRTFKGKHCEVRNHCHPNPCAHSSKCTETIGSGFECSCALGFKGRNCRERNYCLPNPCENDGLCTESASADGFSCQCKETWLGKTCAEKKTACTPNPCKNDGRCLTDGLVGYACVCRDGFTGKSCQENDKTANSIEAMANLLHVKASVDENAVSRASIPGAETSSTTKTSCPSNPCLHGGSCVLDSLQPSGRRCICSDGYSGTLCQEKTCQCENGGTCIGGGINAKCLCKPGFAGNQCQEHIQCNENTCLHGGLCIEQVGGFKCKCDIGYKGKRCEDTDICKPNPCLHAGLCRDLVDTYKCDCKQGFTGKHCEDMDLCQPNPCKNNGNCFPYAGGYQCECASGYRGKTCDQKVHCLAKPCSNDAECIELMPTPESPEGGYKCGCKSGFMGPTCEDQDFCHNEPCKNEGICTNYQDGFVCTCPKRYHGDACQYINHCYGSPCKNGGKCVSGVHDFKCDCALGYRGFLCQETDYCQPNPCQNNGYCTSNELSNGFVCHCTEGFRGLTCTEPDRCRPNPCDHGICLEVAGGYECNCTQGFKGTKCNEIDRCSPNPCLHGGSCAEIVGGVGFVCQCPEGYQGQFCDKKDLCHPNPCEHDGLCHELTVHDDFISSARGRYSKRHVIEHQNMTFSQHKKGKRDLEHPQNMTSKHHEKGKRDLDYNEVQCVCARGYRGKRCNDVDPCYPNPCLHNSVCNSEERSRSTTCNCTLGWKGENCQLMDLCSPNPCRYGTHCIQTDEESYQCVKNLCQPNPCKNLGKCIVVNGEDVTCACTKGWKGKHCEERNACYPNPCFNGGTCSAPNEGGTNGVGGDRYKCNCTKDYKGSTCERPVETTQAVAKVTDICANIHCKNGGTCINRGDSFLCRCTDGFQGAFCEESVCTPSPCANGGSCISYYGIALCKCMDDYTGAHCSALKPSKNPYQPPDTPHYVDVRPVAKSELPHPTSALNKPLTAKDLTSPAFIEKVVEVLKGANDKTEIIQTVEASQKTSKSPKTKPTNKAPPPKNTKPNKALSSQNVPINKAQSVQNTQMNKALSAQNTQHISPLQTQYPTMPISAPKSPNIPMLPQVQQNTFNNNNGDICMVKNPCKNGATCVVRNNGEPECICMKGFSGPICSDIGDTAYSSAPKFFPNDECNHCDVNAICVNGHCICDQGYVGDGLECWLKTIEDVEWICDVNPCQNGGTCKLGRAQCVCRLGYVGKYCETYCPPVIHLSFDSLHNGNILTDESGRHNNAILANGAALVNQQGKCDSAVAMMGGDVLLDGKRFYPKPRIAITVSIWVKVDTLDGIQSIFDTVGGSKSNHSDGQFHFEIEQGKVRWFHRNEYHITIFDVKSKNIAIQPEQWTHIVGTYDANKRIAKLFINGDVVATYRNSGTFVELSQDWEGKVGLGKHEFSHGTRMLMGMVDEFLIFPCALPRLEVLVLMHHCKVYFKHTENMSAKLFEPAQPGLPVPNRNPLLPPQRQPVSLDAKFGQFTNRTEASFLAQAFPQKDPQRYQNYLGFNVNENNYQPQSNDESHFPANNKVQLLDNLERKSSVPFKSINGPWALFSTEWNRILPNVLSDAQIKREKIIAAQKLKQKQRQQALLRFKQKQKQQAIIRARMLQNQRRPALLDQQSRAQPPPFDFGDKRHQLSGPSALFDQISGIQAMNFHNQLQRNPSQRLDPRWFAWTQGLAQTKGASHTNTHSNSLQKNAPGTVATDTHVSSTQNSQGDTDVKQMYSIGIPAQNRMAIPQQQRNRYLALQQQQNPYYALQQQREQQVNRYMQQPQQRQDIHTATHNHPQQQRNRYLALQQQQNPYFALQQQREQQINRYMQQPQQRQDVHTATHNHQWGYGNGNGQGNGQGSKGASGSGGGWGTGGPLSQNLNLPGWGGNPPDGPPTNGQRNDIYDIAMHPLPENKMQIWNAYLKAVAGYKRQSDSHAQADTTNDASSNVAISPSNGNDIAASNHHWGFGNGNGIAHGNGPGGGEGNGGGWGAGGPVKQTLQVPVPGNQGGSFNSWLNPGPKPNELYLREKAQQQQQQHRLDLIRQQNAANARRSTLPNHSNSDIFMQYIQRSLPQQPSLDFASRSLLPASNQLFNPGMNNYLQKKRRRRKRKKRKK